MNENIVRRIIRDILKEAQIGKKIQDHVSKLLDNSELDIIGEFPYNDGFIMNEVKKELNLKISKVAQTNFEFINFYIVKLGGFTVKDGNNRIPLAFKNPGFDKNVSFPYLYIYNDKIIVLRFGSRFYDTNETILKSAQKFIKDSKINLQTMTEKGQIIFIDDFDTENIIDLTDYSKISRPEEPKKEIKPLKQKASYRAGSPYVHPKFGKGIIITSKKFGTDDEGTIIYDVIVDFKDFGQKKLRLKSTKKSNDKIEV